MSGILTQRLKEFENIPDPTTKADLLERMTVTSQAAESLITSHNETTLSTPLHEGGWAVKDHLAHLTAWERGMIALLLKEARFAAMGIDENEVNIYDHNAINDALNKRHKNRPLLNILVEFRQTHQKLLDTLAPLTDEDLQRPYQYYQPQAEGSYTQKPVMGWLAGNTYAHYAEHLLEIGRLISGNPGRTE